jgi:Fe-S-cluster containining protein
VPDLSRCRQLSSLASADEGLLAAFDSAMAKAVELAGHHLVCRAGCTDCCVGPFDITVLDAARLLRGLEDLRRVDGEGARLAVAAAARQWALLVPHFPGERETAELAEDEAAREALFSSFAHLPCPLLDDNGSCRLYAHRPLSCRSFGYPARLGWELLDPCPLNFTTATCEEIERAGVAFDPADLEGKLLAAVAAAGSSTGDTVVCAVLASVAGEAPQCLEGHSHDTADSSLG